MKKLIMSWSGCEIKIGPSTENGAMPAEASMGSIGVISAKTSTLESSEGEELKAVASGGAVVAWEKGEGTYQFKTRVKEPGNELFTLLGLGTTSGEDFNVKTHVPDKSFALQVTPKNLGATGIKAPFCMVTFNPGSSEDEGQYADLIFTILPVLNDQYEVDKWYTRFKKVAAVDPA